MHGCSCVKRPPKHEVQRTSCTYRKLVLVVFGSCVQRESSVRVHAVSLATYRVGFVLEVVKLPRAFYLLHLLVSVAPCFVCVDLGLGRAHVFCRRFRFESARGRLCHCGYYSHKGLQHQTPAPVALFYHLGNCACAVFVHGWYLPYELRRAYVER